MVTYHKGQCHWGYGTWKYWEFKSSWNIKDYSQSFSPPEFPSYRKASESYYPAWVTNPDMSIFGTSSL